MERNYTMMVGVNGMELWQATLAHQAHPTVDTATRLKAINDKISKEAAETKQRNIQDFINLYGADMYVLVEKLNNPKYTHWMGSDPHYFTWEIRWDEDRDDTYVVRFFKGKFDYVVQSCGGYAGTTVLETDITKERVLELLSK